MVELATFTSQGAGRVLHSPLAFYFKLKFPIMLLLLLSTVGSTVPRRTRVAVFGVSGLAPNVAIFKVDFVSLFSSVLVTGSEAADFVVELFASPLGTRRFVVNCALPLLPVTVLRDTMYIITTFFLKLRIDIGVLLVLTMGVPVTVIFVSLKLLLNALLGRGTINKVYNTLLAGLST